MQSGSGERSRSKDVLSSAALLRHYDPNNPLVLHCDASPYGIGAVVSHRTGEKTEHPIAYSSRVLSSTVELVTYGERGISNFLSCRKISSVSMWLPFSIGN